MTLHGRSIIPLGPRRFVLDVFPSEIAWVTSRDSFVGPKLERCGRTKISTDDETRSELARLLRSFKLSEPRVDAVLPSSANVQIQRLDLPGVSASEARGIAQRKCAERLATSDEEALEVSSMVQSDHAGSTAWIVSAPSPVCQEANSLLRGYGVNPDRLVPHGLAIGALVAALPRLETGLTAFLWLSNGASTCIIADNRGWSFARDIPLQVGRSADSLAQGEDSEGVVTELERTFYYVNRELGLGQVVRLVLCGSWNKTSSLQRTIADRFDLSIDCLESDKLAGNGHTLHPKLAAALGASLLPRRHTAANLLPKQVCESRSYARVRGRLVSAIASLVLCSAVTSSLGVVRYVSAETRLEGLHTEIAQTTPQRAELAKAEALRKTVEQLKVVQATVDRPEPPWSAMFDLLARVAPANVYLQRLETWREGLGWRLRLTIANDHASRLDDASWIESYREGLAALDLFRISSLELEQESWVELDAQASGSVSYQLEGWVAAVEPMERQSL